MMVLIGRGIGYLFSLTNNLGWSIVIVAAIMFIFRHVINFSSKNKKEYTQKTGGLIKNTKIQDIESISVDDFKKISNKIKEKFNYNIVMNFICTLIYTIVAICVFITIINAEKYIPGVDRNTLYPFLFIDNILAVNTVTILPTLCAFISFAASENFNFKEDFLFNITKSLFLLAIQIFIYSIYSYILGPIYLIYVISIHILTIISKIFKKLVHCN